MTVAQRLQQHTDDDRSRGCNRQQEKDQHFSYDVEDDGAAALSAYMAVWESLGRGGVPLCVQRGVRLGGISAHAPPPAIAHDVRWPSAKGDRIITH
eukprot:218952-Pleurochrysis_carterae.AAC.1